MPERRIVVLVTSAASIAGAVGKTRASWPPTPEREVRTRQNAFPHGFGCILGGLRLRCARSARIGSVRRPTSRTRGARSHTEPTRAPLAARGTLGPRSDRDRPVGARRAPHTATTVGTCSFPSAGDGSHVDAVVPGGSALDAFNLYTIPARANRSHPRSFAGGRPRRSARQMESSPRKMDHVRRLSSEEKEDQIFVFYSDSRQDHTWDLCTDRARQHSWDVCS